MENLTPLSQQEKVTTDGGLLLAWVAYRVLKGAYEHGYDTAQNNCTCKSED